MCIAAFEPVKVLIHRFLHFVCHGAHGEALGGDVVSDDHCAFELRMAHFFQCGANWDSKLADVVKCSQFRFGCGEHDVFDDA